MVGLLGFPEPWGGTDDPEQLVNFSVTFDNGLTLTGNCKLRVFDSLRQEWLDAETVKLELPPAKVIAKDLGDPPLPAGRGFHRPERKKVAPDT